MNPSQLIARKRDGGELSPEEIAWFVGGYASGTIPDYQMAAMAMAVFLRGMSSAETASLTEAMWRSGITFDWPAGHPPIVDKHSTGGIGDKTSLILAPLLACCGLHVPMISGRGLGPTGGTLDKLESIAGFRTDLSTREVRDVVRRVGCVITGASAEIAPADRKLYALRDVTATVASIPLITASIMSKKLAEGLDCLVLDVKFGSGAFMKSLEEARRLAQLLVDTGNRVGVRTAALLTDMNQPLGRMAGNGVEVDESLAALSGEGPDDLMQVTLALGAELLVLSGVAASIESATTELQRHIDSGRAISKFREMAAAQGGDIDAPRPRAVSFDVLSPRAGRVHRIDNEQLGWAVIEMGGGRKTAADPIDHSVGIEMLVRVGDDVAQGQPIVRLYCPPAEHSRIGDMILAAIRIADEPSPPTHLVRERVEPNR